MTYCVGLRLDRGLVFMSDTRTNSGVDNIATYGKMHRWCTPGERAIVLLSAGNRATSQAVVSLLDERSVAPADRAPSILEAPTMFQVARLVGQTLKEVIANHAFDAAKPGGDDDAIDEALKHPFRQAVRLVNGGARQSLHTVGEEIPRAARLVGQAVDGVGKEEGEGENGRCDQNLAELDHKQTPFQIAIGQPIQPI